MFNQLYSSLFETSPADDEETTPAGRVETKTKNNSSTKNSSNVSEESSVTSHQVMHVESPNCKNNMVMESSEISPGMSPLESVSSLSPIKTSRVNGMLENSMSSCPSCPEPKAILPNFDCSNPATQHSLFIFLFERVARIEGLLDVSRETNDQLQESNDLLNCKMVDMSAVVSKLSTENADKEEQISSLRLNNVHLKEKVENIQKQVTGLDGVSKSTQNELIDLTKSVNLIAAEIDIQGLDDDHDDLLNEKIDDLAVLVSALSTESDEKERKLVLIKQENTWLKETVDRVQDQISKLDGVSKSTQLELKDLSKSVCLIAAEIDIVDDDEDENEENGNNDEETVDNDDNILEKVLSSQNELEVKLTEFQQSLNDVQVKSGKNQIDLEISKAHISDLEDRMIEQLTKVSDEIYKIEKKIIKTSQYTRRQNLVRWYSRLRKFE